MSAYSEEDKHHHRNINKQRNRKRWLYFGVFVFLIFIFILPLSIYFSLPYLIQPVFQYFLAPYGANIELLEVDDINIHGTRNISAFFHYAKIELDDGTELVLTDVTAKRINKQYDISVGQFAINQDQTRNNTNTLSQTKQEQINLSDYLPQYWLNTLPEFDLHIKSFDIYPHKISGMDFFAELHNAELRIKTHGSIAKNSPTLPILEDGNFLPIELNAANDVITLSAKGSKTTILNTIKIEKSEHETLRILTNTELNIPKLQFFRGNGNNLVIEDLKLTTSTRLTTPQRQTLSLHSLAAIELHSHLQTELTINGSSTVQGEFKHSMSLDHGDFQLQIDPQTKPLIDLHGELLNLMGYDQEKNQNQSLTLHQNQPISLTGSVDNQDRISQLRAQVIDAPENSDADTNSNLTLEYIDKKSHLTASIDPQFTDDISKPLQSFTLGVRINGNPATLLQVLTPSMQLTKPNINFNSDLIFDFKNKNFIVTLNEKALLNADRLVYENYTLTKPKFAIPTQSIDLSLNQSSVPEKFSAINMSVSLDEFHMDKIHSNAANLNVSLALFGDAYQLKLESSPLDINNGDRTYYIPPLIFSSNITQSQLAPANAQFTMANICEDPLIEGRWEPIVKNGQLSGHYIRADWQRTFTPLNTFRKWLNTSMPPIDFTSGELTGSVALKAGDAVTLDDLNIELNNANGLGKFGTLNGVQLQLSSVQALSPLQSGTGQKRLHHFAVKGSAKSLETGVTAKDISLDSELYEIETGWHAAINQATTSMFGGQAKLEPQDLALDDDISVKILLDNLDLAKMVGTQQMQGLNTTGKISGYIPIHYKNGQLIIDDGQLKSTEHGKIQYTSPLSQSSDLNQQLKFTLDILKDFQYSELTSKVAYDKNALKFSSHIAGRNPNIEKGRPIELNLNTEIGLAGAFEVMRLQAGIESKLEEFVNKKINPSTNKYYCEQ